jgi:hypothetical protein
MQGPNSIQQIAIAPWTAILITVAAIVNVAAVVVLAVLNSRHMKTAQIQADVLLSYLQIAREQTKIWQELAAASSLQATAANQSLAILQQQIKTDEQRAKIVLRKALQTTISNTATWKDRLSATPLYVPKTIDLMPTEWSFAVYAAAQIGPSAYEGMLRVQEHINAAKPAIEEFVSSDYSSRAAYSAARKGKQAKENLQIAQIAMEEVLAMITD